MLVRAEYLQHREQAEHGEMRKIKVDGQILRTLSFALSEKRSQLKDVTQRNNVICFKFYK